MTEFADSDTNSPAFREELVAYLDGELDDNVARIRVEQLLAANPDVRTEVQQLERAWDMLDKLPRAEVDAGFTQTTVEMVAVRASEEIDQERHQRPRRQIRKWAWVGVSLFLAGLLGAAGANLLWPHPDDALLRDLRVLQNLDEYEQVGDVEFLRRLHDEEMFLDDPED